MFMFISALFTLAPNAKHPLYPRGEWVYELWYIHTMDTMEYYASIKKKEV